MPWIDPEKKRECNRRYKARHPGSWRESQLWRKYGIRLADWNAILARQRGRCAICRTKEPGGRGTWHVDHDHKTGKVRGLLCSACNSGLGQFRDDPARLRAAARYLLKSRVGERPAESGSTSGDRQPAPASSGPTPDET